MSHKDWEYSRLQLGIITGNNYSQLQMIRALEVVYYYYMQCPHYPIGETTTLHDVTSLDQKANKVTGNTLLVLFDANNVNKVIFSSSNM